MTAAPAPAAPLSADEVAAIRAGYGFDAPAIELGALVNGTALPEVPVRIPLAMMNRHGLIAGATGTGKTKTLQLLAEQLSAAGVPVFAADIKGDLSGIASPGASSPALLQRTAGMGQHWTPSSSPTEYFTLGGLGTGIPIRASVREFGPLLLGKVLGLNPTQESSLGLVFHYAADAGLPLIELEDLRAVLMHLISDAGKAELAELGGLSSATAAVILRELVGFRDQGADAFFGQPSIDVQVFLRRSPDGLRGMVSLLEVPSVQDRPELFSTFLMWLLRELYRVLPEVGDSEQPELVFFFDEAHLLFAGASQDFLQVVTQTVRLIRSKGVGIFFVTQTPKDVPGDVLAQLGSRVQHQLRTHTPDDARALKAAVSTYPVSGYDLAQVLQNLPTGEAIVTVMNERGAPSPVAWTRLRSPQSSMSPTPPEERARSVAASPLLAQFGNRAHPTSARELLEQRDRAAMSAAEPAAESAEPRRPERAERRERPDQAERPEPAAFSKRPTAKPARAARRRRGLAGRLIEKLFGSTR